MDIRKEFLQYFHKKDHLVLPSAGLIPSDDPSVLLTTAGMQQFKAYYLGTKKPPGPRIATVQKCFRTSDIDRVGYTDRHLTFFEMLGNFAFADYFKTEAIGFAMDFITDVLNISTEKLCAGVFSGDDKIPPDIEAYDLWLKWGIKPGRMYKFGRKDNFWGPAGDTGPCGPCTEIYYDFGDKSGCGKPDCSPACDCGRFLEIWNLVFTQYNFNGSSFEDLPNRNIDTGMGLERIAAVMEGDPSVFKTALFKTVVLNIEQLAGLKHADPKDMDEKTARCIKIIADHSRAATFLIADGVLPSNESRGYILRRIIRRAARFAKLLNIEGIFLGRLSETVISNYSTHYPELSAKKDLINKTLYEEENKFLRTLKEGNRLLGQVISDLKKKNEKFINPADSFKLYDTFGFPVELTVEILNESGISLDFEEFKKQMEVHSAKSKDRSGFDKKVDSNLAVYKKILQNPEIEFTGYTQNRTSARILKLLELKEGNALETSELSAGQDGEIIVDRTPFYSEKGGALGDRGLIKSVSGVFEVQDTQSPVEGLVLHRGRVKDGIFKTGEEITAEVDFNFRKKIRANHTATHILHWALKAVAGKDANQAGSFVADEKFRFDYFSGRALNSRELEKLETLVNERIQKNDIVRCFETTLEYAKETGAVALFDEKYGKYVRLVEIDDYSRELCGGIHAERTGEVGLFKILSDASIGQNIRRIEAVTGMAAFKHFQDINRTLKTLSAELETDYFSVEEKIILMKDSLKKSQDDLALLKRDLIKHEIVKKNSLADIKDMDMIFFDFTTSTAGAGMESKIIGILGDELLNEYETAKGGRGLFLLFYNVINDKPLILLQCSKKLNSRGINCAEIVRQLSPLIKGGGGGKPDFSQIGGFDPGMLSAAVDFIRDHIVKNIS